LGELQDQIHDFLGRRAQLVAASQTNRRKTQEERIFELVGAGSKSRIPRLSASTSPVQ